MHNLDPTPETRKLGKDVKGSRQFFGYTRQTFGEMLGFTERGAYRNMAGIEGGYKKISAMKVAMIARWLRDGLPKDAPEPDLSNARAKGARIHRENRDKREAEQRAENTPRVIILKQKETSQ